MRGAIKYRVHGNKRILVYFHVVISSRVIRQLPNNNIPRATTRDCPYIQTNIVGAIPCGCPYVVYLFFGVALSEMASNELSFFFKQLFSNKKNIIPHPLC